MRNSFWGDEHVLFLIVFGSILCGLNIEYEEYVEKILRRNAIHYRFQRPIVNVGWEFILMTISMIVAVIFTEGPILNKLFGAQAQQCDAYDVIHGTEILFVFAISITIHHTLSSLLFKRWNCLDTLVDLSLIAVLFLSYLHGCPYLGASLAFMVYRVRMICLPAQICHLVACWFNYPRLRKVTKALFGVQLTVWLFAYGYVFPVVASKHIHLNIALAIHIALSFVDSVLFKVLLTYIWPLGDRRRNLGYFLFGRDPFVNWINRLESSVTEEPEEMVIQNNFARLMHSIILLRRRMRARHQENERIRLSRVSRVSQISRELDETGLNRPSLYRRRLSSLHRRLSSLERRRSSSNLNPDDARPGPSARED